MRLAFPLLFDILIVDDPDQIRWLNEHPDVLRPPDESGSFLLRLVNQLTVVAMSFEGQVLPVFLRRQDPGRARKQRELADALDEPTRVVNAETTWLGTYVAGYDSSKGEETSKSDASGDPDDTVGIYVQQWCGRLFDPRYIATPETYAAGRRVARFPTEPPWRKLGKRAKAQFASAKRTLADAADNDIHAIHATSIGMENIARSVRRMRSLAKRAGVTGRTAEEAMRQCLIVPPVLLRGCEREVQAPFLRVPLNRRSLVVFLLARAYDKSGDLTLAFLGDTWSACPAQHIVPHMLRAVWKSAIEVEAKRSPALETLRKATNVAVRVLRAVGTAG